MGGLGNFQNSCFICCSLSLPIRVTLCVENQQPSHSVNPLHGEVVIASKGGVKGGVKGGPRAGPRAGSRAGSRDAAKDWSSPQRWQIST